MPRKRIELDREAKIDEVLTQAVEVLRSGGDNELTVQRMARDLGLARAAVYWYFPTRDDLFVAAAGRLLAQQFVDLPDRGDYRRRIEEAVDRLADIYDVYMLLQHKAATMPAAAELLDQFQRSTCDGLKALLTEHVPPQRLQATADTIIMFIDGLLSRRYPPRRRHTHLRFALDTVLNGPA